MAPSETSTEDRILEAARTVFVRHGTHAASLKDIAQEADVNQALLHYYFRDKKTLADTVFEEVASTFIPRMQAILAGDQTIEEKVHTFVPEYIEQMQENPYLPSYVMWELNQNPGELKSRLRAMGVVPFEGIEELDQQLRRRAAAGTLRLISAEQFVVNLISLSVFPFVARPLIEAMMDLDDAAFEAFVDARTEQIPEFVLGALQP